MPNYCERCILPETRPGVCLDAEGVCSGCRNAERKPRIDWEARHQAFAELAKEVKALGRDYDCVIPVSGGKDSYWQVVTCLEHGLRPLCVTYVYPGRTDHGLANLRRLVALGVDHLELQVNPEVERMFVDRAFRSTATSGLVAHMAIYAWPFRIAVKHDIPLVVYGENSAFEYGGDDPTLMGDRVDRRWLASFGVTHGTTAADWVGNGLSRRDLSAFTLPSDDVLADAGTRAVFLGHYFWWDPERSLETARRHGFEALDEGPRVGHYDYVNIDDDMIGVHHHAKWFKFGITRSFDTLSMEIRAGRLSRDEAVEHLRSSGDETPWTDIGVFCDYLAMSVEDYFGVMEQFRNLEIWRRRDDRWCIDEFLVPGFDWPTDPDLGIGRRP